MSVPVGEGGLYSEGPMNKFLQMSLAGAGARVSPCSCLQGRQGQGPGGGRPHGPCLEERLMLGVGFNSMVQFFMGNGHMSIPPGQNNGKTRLKTLPSCNFVGRW